VPNNINNFTNALNNTDWTPVYVINDTDTSFDTFWNIFKTLYDEHFPEIRVRFNINKHRLNGFMTDELLEARKEKITSHKAALLSKTPEDRALYITNRNTYNTMLRQTKQKYYADNLNKNTHNAKRTWQLLKEAANLNKNSSKIEKIRKVDGTLLTESGDIANEFNDFFYKNRH
jgi:site-specific DNA-adenine methylase